MDTAKIVQEIDAEIARLTAARNMLTGPSSDGRATHPGKESQKATSVGSARASRLTPAGRKHLSELMKKRWADRKKKTSAKAK